MDLSNEVLNNDFGQGAAKISEVKVGGRKKITNSAQFEPMLLESAELADIFFLPLTLTTDIFSAPLPKSMFSTSFVWS